MQTEDYEIKKSIEAKLHRLTRQQNDERLASELDNIQTASRLDLLEPFAKAYLGLFLEIDSSFSPEQRIRFIAGDKLFSAVMQGLSVALNNIKQLPDITTIGQLMAEDERMELGYVVLVGMDLHVKNNNYEQALNQLSADVLAAALCFHYANSSIFQNKWVSSLVECRPELVATTLQQFWLPQMNRKARYLPGLQTLLKTAKGQQLVGDIIVPILESWTGYKKQPLNILLAIALRYANANKLLPVIETILTSNRSLNPRMRMVWLTSAFILEPDDYWQQMQDYTYRSKEKLLPLLDFTVALLDEIKLEAGVLTKIIRLIAPKFPPHIDDFGKLAANPQKTLRLFYELANRDDDVGTEINWLRRARVMKIVSPVLDEVETLNNIKSKQQKFPQFKTFMTNLLTSGRLKEKRSRFKNKL